MKVKLTLSVILFFLISNTLLAQTIKGRILDEDSNTGIAYVTIQADQNHKTISNENGEFELTVKSLPCEIYLSHISYQAVKAKVTEASSTFKLKPITQHLNEVVIGNNALSIMKSAYQKALVTVEEPFYAKSFLRQIAYEADKPTYLNEILFNAEWKSYGLLRWAPTESRFLKNESHVSYTNLSVSTFELSGYLSNSSFIKPLSPKLDSLYTFKVKSTYQLNGEEVVVINCLLKIKTNKRYFEGDYYVNTETHHVLKIDGKLKNFNFDSKGLLGAKTKEVNLMSQYRLNSDLKNILDFSVFTVKSKMTVMGLGTKNLELCNTLYMIDYGKQYNLDLKALQSKTNDVKTTQNMVYNADFWKSNVIIKRTVKEEEAIRILEGPQ